MFMACNIGACSCRLKVATLTCSAALNIMLFFCVQYIQAIDNNSFEGCGVVSKLETGIWCKCGQCYQKKNSLDP